LSAQGDVDRARYLAAEELALARRFGAPRAVGLALLGAAVVERGDARIARLRDALATLEGSGARFDQARALVLLGGALRIARDRTAARVLLRDGLDLASRCGAAGLAGRARAELVADGARPRRDSRRGPAALTAGELRVARMAAEGLSNREIAQALFVTTKTVETHLGNTYAKLAVTGRAQLSASLAAGASF
jgi:DNA-binding CsgD family transcriptional regulator